jgi:hypothetical protein
MATFTLTVALNTNDLKQMHPRVSEALRNAADQLVNMASVGTPATPYTKVDAVGNTQYQWTVA